MNRRYGRRMWVLSAAVALWVGLPACGGDDDGGTGPGGGTGTAIGPAGGVVVSADGEAELTVPAGALDHEVDLTLASAASAPGGALGGTTYTCGPAGTTFAVPAVLEIGYDPADLAPGTAAARLRLSVEVGGVWAPVTGSQVDSTAHLVTAPLDHFSTYGVTVASPATSAEAYLLDTPSAGNEFDDLTAAIAWLESQLGYEDEGVLHWRTDAAQEVDDLSFSFDLRVEVETGRTPVLRASNSLVVDAVGAVDLSGFTIEATGLVLNANRGVALSGCTVPEIAVNVGGVDAAPFPAAEPAYRAKSARAAKSAMGAALVGNSVTAINVNLVRAQSQGGSYTVQDNSAGTVNVGGPGTLVNATVDVCITPAAPNPIPVPYPNFSANLGGDSTVKMRGLKGVRALGINSQVTGLNRVFLEKNEGDEAGVNLAGSGGVIMSSQASKVQFVNWSFDVQTVQATIDSLDTRELKIVGSGGTKALTEVTIDLNEPKAADLLELDFTQDTGATIAVNLVDPDLQGGFHCFVPEGGDVTLNVTGGSVSGGSLWVGPNEVRKSGPKRLPAATGAITLTEVAWSGSGFEHVEIFAQQVPVTIADCTFSYSGDPAMPVGLTEIGGAISVTGNTLTEMGIGIVDCTGAATVDDNDITIGASTGYGVSVGGSAAVTVSSCTINCGGGASGILAGATNGGVTIDRCTIIAPTMAVFAGEADVTADNNAMVTGMITIAAGTLHFANNTCSGVQIIDDYTEPGLQNDPVADNDGVLPGMVMTRMDWDGNGCCDYPPEWNAQDEHGACAVCTGVGGKAFWR